MLQHTFVICAYKESQYLAECIQSLKRQTVPSNIIMITSTPNAFIEKTAETYAIPLVVNEGEGGIVQDWNFGYKLAKTELVTIAHQDDIYDPGYAKALQNLESVRSEGLIYFCDYAEIRNGRRVVTNLNLKIKRLLLFPLRIKAAQKSIFIRRRVLSLGSAICCPAVTFFKQNLPETVFKVGFHSDEDWEAWEMLSKKRGRFIYNPAKLMGHRIHEESETSAILGDNARSKEDFIMFCKFWPKPIAKILTRLYSKSEISNQL